MNKIKYKEVVNDIVDLMNESIDLMRKHKNADTSEFIKGRKYQAQITLELLSWRLKKEGLNPF